MICAICGARVGRDTPLHPDHTDAELERMRQLVNAAARPLSFAAVIYLLRVA